MSNAATQPAHQVTTRWEDYSPWEIVEHLVATHHAYARAELDRLGVLVAEVSREHGRSSGDVRDVATLFAALRQDLETHLAEEEHELFPWVEQLRIADAEGTAAPRGSFGTVRDPIRLMQAENDSALDVLRRMREASGGFDPARVPGAAWRALASGLDALEADLREHIRLESEVLFPMLIERERDVVG